MGEQPQEIGAGAAGAADSPGAARRRSWWVVLGQIGGFVAGLGVLAWCVWLVASDQKKLEQAEKILRASPLEIALLIGLSMATVVLSGLAFWAVGRPLKAVTAPECVAVNGVCSLLGYLPMKASLLFRFLYHRRVNDLGWLTITAWLGAVAGIIVLSLAPGVIATVVFEDVNAAWFAMTLSGLVAIAVLLPWAAGAFAGDLGMSRFRAIAGWTRIGLASRLVNSEFFGKLHRGLALLADRKGVALAIVIRAADMGVQAVRFYVVARIIEVEVTPAQCVIAGVAYFFIQATSPAGVAGPREGGLIAILGTGFAPVVVAVTAGEAAANLILGLAGAAWLRLDRVFFGGGPASPRPEPGA